MGFLKWRIISSKEKEAEAFWVSETTTNTVKKWKMFEKAQINMFKTQGVGKWMHSDTQELDGIVLDDILRNFYFIIINNFKIIVLISIFYVFSYISYLLLCNKLLHLSDLKHPISIISVFTGQESRHGLD